MWSVALTLACWQYSVLLPSSSQVFSTFAEQFFSDTLNNFKSHLKYLCIYKSWNFIFCLLFFIDGVESAWPAGCFFSSGNHMTTSCFVSYHFGKKDSVTGLEVILQSSSHIFQVTGLAFSPRKCKFFVWFLARTHKAKVLTECCYM